MFRFFRSLALLCLLAGASAQELPGGNLTEIRIAGTSPTLERLVRVSLQVRPGTPVERVDLEAERNRVLAMGTFAEVSLAIEDRGNGPILFIEVVENPRIAEIRITGTSLDAAQLAQLLAVLEDRHLLAPEAVLNTIRAQEARETIQLAYRQAGIPFDVPVTLSVRPAEEIEGVVLEYEVSETVPISEIVFEASAVLAEAILEEAFAPLRRQAAFTIEGYQQAISAVAQAYHERGYRGSGVDPERTELIDGVLSVRLLELRIAGIDTTAVGVDPGALTLQVGDLFNYDILLEDVRNLAAGRTRDIRLETRAGPRGEVRVVFQVGPPETAGPIADILIEGNTAIPDEDIAAVLELTPGDTFTSVLAGEDFGRVLQLYRERGYAIVPVPDFNYLEGTYVQRLQEISIAGYEVVFTTEDIRTDEIVITRYLPPPGSLYNENELRAGLLEVARLGIATPIEAPPAATARPDEIVVRVILREEPARQFRPELSYDTEVGLAAALSFFDRNLFGQAHNFRAEVSGQSTGLGIMFGGSIGYDIPWLYLDVLDFPEVPTSVSASIFSIVSPSQPLTSQGQLRLPLPGSEQEALIGSYLQRDSGLSFSIGRQVWENTTLLFAARGVYSDYHLEPGNPCMLDEHGNVTDPTCTLAPAEVIAGNFLPQAGFSSFASTTAVYDDRDSPEYPSEGQNITGRLGIGLGSDYRDPVTQEQATYNYEQLEFGFRTYTRLADHIPIGNPSHVLAYRINMGHQFGGNYPVSRYFIVGQTQLEATQIRGFTREDFVPSQTYLTSSLEYRYDFGLTTAVTQTIIGIAFVDLGYASSVPGFADYQTPLFAGAGLGVQLNLGLGNVFLPAIRFDYGISERNPRGVFGFRIGPVF